MFQLHDLLQLPRQALLVGTHNSVCAIGTFYLSAHTDIAFLDLVCTNGELQGIFATTSLLLFSNRNSDGSEIFRAFNEFPALSRPAIIL